VERYEITFPLNYFAQLKIWDDRIPFDGWAVAANDPLWQLGTKNAAMPTTFPVPLEMVLNKSLFTQYFNCADYVKTLQQQLPFWEPPSPESVANPLYCLTDNILWLDTQVGTERRELLPFHIHWQTRIPTMHQLAFLFPLSTLNALKISNYFTNLKYYPEAQVDNHWRIKELTLWADKVDTQQLSPFQTCLSNTQMTNNRINFKYPLPHYWVTACAKKYHLPIQSGEERLSPPFLTITDAEESFYFQANNDDYLTINCPKSQPTCQPCERIIQASAWTSLEHTTCTTNQTTADMMELIGSYQKALTYVNNRKELADYLQKINTLPQSATDARNAFYIHPTYNDAHVRFLFIQKVIDMLKIVYSPFFLIFLIILLLVQMGIVITHRLHNYGILLAKGFSWRQLYQMLLLQIALNFLVALGIATVIIETIRTWFQAQLAELVLQKPYIDHILISDLDLLPLTWLDYSLVSLLTLGMAYLIATLMMRYMIPPRRVEPAYLFKI
jgi:hypothetical protein